MTGRDPRPGLLRRVATADATVRKCEQATEAARAAKRARMREATAGGVTKADIARLLGTSESRVRQDISRGHAEAS